jgi:hypothetical protein
VLQTGTTLSGAPTREGSTDVLTGAGVLTNGFGPATGTTINGGTGPYANFINQGPAPGAPPTTIAGTVMNGTKQPIDYGDAVPLPVIFSRLQSSDRNWTYSLEANRMWRIGTDRFGTTFDLFMGARYLDFDEIFQVIGTGGTLANSWWQAGDNNHILGGQFGMRTRRQWERLVFNTELRLVTAADFQTASVKGVIGTELTQTTVNPVTTFTTVTVPTTAVSPAPTTTNQLIFITTQPNNPGQGVAATRLNQPLNLLTTGFATTAHPVTFAPMGEARLNWSYQLFSGVSLNFGYTGLMAYGVGRPSRMINYTLPALSVNTLADKEVMVLTGLNAGVRFNY